MDLRELKSKEAVRQNAVMEKRVRVFMGAAFYQLSGHWQWDLETKAVFCSDVMFSLQNELAGTKSIFHPDDVASLKEMLGASQQVPFLQFRVITTYGEVKTLVGRDIAVHKETEDWQQQTLEAAAQQVEQKARQTHLQFLKEIEEKSSHFNNTGRWYFNAATHQTWYSDFVYQLHGLAPQSLNAHLNTFHSFIHPEDRELVLEYTDRAFHEKAPLHIDYRIAVADSERWVSYKTFWFFSERGEEILGGIVQDITEQKIAEKEAELYKNLVQFQRQQLLYDEQQVNIGHWQVALLTRKTTYSDQYYRIFGLKPQSLAPTITSFLNYVHPDDRAKVEAAHRQLIYEHALPDLEYRILRNDGKTRFILQKAKLVTVEDELMITGIIQDITVQRMLEKKIAAQNDALQLKQWLAQQADEQANLVSWVMDLEENTIDWSESFYKFAGLPKAQSVAVTEKTLLSLVHPHEHKAFKHQWSLAVQQKQEASFEVRFLVRGVVQYMTALFRIYQHNGKEYLLGSLRNTTAEQILQQQLSQRVQLAESLTENILDRVMITDSNNTILLWNRACETAYNLKKAEALGQNFFDIFPYLKTEEQMQMLQKVQRGEKVVVEGAPSAQGKGHYNLHLIPLLQDDQVSSVLHVVKDVTRETELRNSLNDRLHLIESLVQSSLDRIIALDHNMNYLYWNRKAEDYYGLPKEAVVGKNVLEIFPRLINDPTYVELRRALKGETIYVPADASQKRYFDTNIIPIKNERGEVASIVWMAHDLSREIKLQREQYKMQQQLQVEHNRLKIAQAIGRLGSFEWDAATDTLYWSDELYRIHGLEPQSEVMTLERVKNFVHPDDMGAFDEVVRQLQSTPISLSLIHRIVRADGVERTVARQLQSFPNADGAITNLSGTVQDITERVEAQKALAKSSLLVKDTEDIALTGSYEADLQTMTFHFSDGMFRLFGEEPGSFVPTLDFIDMHSYPDDVASTKVVLDAAISNKQPYHYVRRIYRKDGELRTLEAHGKVETDSHGNAIRLLGLVQDITERKKAEKELLESKLFSEQVMDATPDFIMVFNFANNKIEYVNRSGYRGDDERYYQTLRITYKELIERAHADDRDALHRFIEELRTAIDDKIRELEYRVVKDGTTIWYKARGKVFKRDTEGRPTHYISVVQDITENKKAEQQILQLKDAIAQKATDKYLTLFNSIDEGFYQCEVILDEANNPVEVFYLEENPAAVRIIGKSLAGKTLKEINPEYELAWYEIFGNVALTGESRRMEQYSGPDGKWFNFYVSKVGNLDSRQVAVVFQDVTERKKAEEALREVNARLIDVLETTTDAFYAVNADFIFTYVNKKAAQLWNRDPQSLIGKHYWTEFPAAVGSESYQKHYEALQEGRPLHYQTLSPLVGVWIDVGIYPGKNGNLSVFFRDISEQKQTEENLKNFTAILEQQVAERTKELQKNLAILHHTEELAQIGSWEYNIASGQFNWSEGMYRLFGLPQGSKVAPETYLDFAVDEDRTAAKRIMKNLKKTHQQFEETLQIKRADGKRLLQLKGSVVNDENGIPQRMVGVDIDITDIQEAEHRLKESRNLLEQTAQASPDAITIYDLKKKQPLFLNNCLAQWIDTTTEELVNMGIDGRLALVHADDRLRLLHFNEKLKAAKDGTILTLEYRLHAKDGSLMWMRNRAKVFSRDAAGNVTHILSVLQDITEQKAAERVLKTLNTSLEKKNAELESKNEEITSFAFVASHDLKEPLRKLHTFSDWLLTKEPALSDPGRQTVEKMTLAVKRLDMLITDILAITKVHVGNEKVKPVDLNLLLQQVKLDMKEALEQSGTVIDAEPLPHITGSENQLLYLLKNLVSNGIKFQPKGGQPHLHIRYEVEGDSGKLSVSDNGIGIQPEYHKKIFQIFRRLHPPSEYEGSGMGLAICKKIMEKHGGKITVESAVGEGTTFTCWFPVLLST